MGIFPTCKVCTKEAPESLQHHLFECPLAKQVWEAFYYVWHKWGALNDVTLSWPFVMLGEAIFEREDDLPKVQRYHVGGWPFVMLGEAIFEREDDLPKVQRYHVGGFSYIRQPLDILRSFILYFLL
jgi:hypothetical protein